MPKWTKPTESMPNVEVGDRIVIIVMERPHQQSAIHPQLVILEATENGWWCNDTVYNGYTPDDGVLWSTEKDICQIASELSL